MAVEIPGEYGFVVGLATLIVESIIAVLLYRTVRDYGEVAKVSRIEAKHRFRPWVGPAGGIDFLRVSNAKNQYTITIKNFGEIPASSVVGMSGARTDLPTREGINKDGLEKFNLGPLLPYMEKRYWIFIDTEMIEKAKQANSPIYVVVYFLYEFPSGGKSGYGMISQLDPSSNTFVHRDMWVDQEIANSSNKKSNSHSKCFRPQGNNISDLWTYIHQSIKQSIACPPVSKVLSTVLEAAPSLILIG